jgi:hypothetical protein
MKRKAICTECGKRHEKGLRASKEPRAVEFCSPKCRQDFTNRRYQRGAELYDRIMQHPAGVVADTALTNDLIRLQAMYLQGDIKKRKGRPSWSEFKVDTHNWREGDGR